VTAARERQLARFKGRKVYANAQMGPRDIKRHCAVAAEGERLLETAVTRLGFSARAYDRILKVARTIADLEGKEAIATAHVSEAIQYRMMDKFR
jgi:magnesium chelatase family protein